MQHEQKLPSDITRAVAEQISGRGIENELESLGS